MIDIDYSLLAFKHNTPIQVRFTDIDMMNHVNNSVQISYCDVARVDYFEKLLNIKIGRNEESLIVAALAIDFKMPTFINDRIVVQNKVVEIGNKSLKMAQQIINIDTGDVKSRITTILSGYNHMALQSIVIPDRWKDDIASFEGDVIFKYKK